MVYWAPWRRGQEIREIEWDSSKKKSCSSVEGQGLTTKRFYQFRSLKKNICFGRSKQYNIVLSTFEINDKQDSILLI